VEGKVNECNRDFTPTIKRSQPKGQNRNYLHIDKLSGHGTRLCARFKYAISPVNPFAA